MQHSLFTVNTVTEIICFLVSIFCLFKDKNPYWRGFVLYLFLVCITEMGGIFLRNIEVSNYSIYIGFLPFECLMVSTFFYHIFKKYNHKAILLYGWLSIFMLFFGLELWGSHFGSFTYRTATFMSVVFVIASLYFYLLIIKDEHFRKLGSYPPFWIVNGILFFYFGSTACNVFFDYLIHADTGSTNMSIRYAIFNILNVLLYCCWSYAFICRYRQRKSSFSLH